jgi:glycosyltransferase involved in cell wall biosynthesis
MQKISVVIPTHNRCQKLLLTLESFENQTIQKDNFEVIVVDNGSNDETVNEVEVFRRNNSLNLSFFRIPQPSASRARNLGIQNAKFGLILNTDDDIVASENLLEEHLKFHQDYNFAHNIAVLGYITWHNSLRVSNFMKFVNEYGPQFGYSLIKDETNLSFNFFYSSNISISKRFLLENGSFDEDLPEYWYDAELGYRLKQKGLKIIFNKNAMAYHMHPTSIFSFLKRQEKIGNYAIIFSTKHPELKDFLLLRKNNKHSNKKNGIARYVYSNFLYRFYSLLLNFYYKRGIKSGYRNFKNQSKFMNRTI